MCGGEGGGADGGGRWRLESNEFHRDLQDLQSGSLAVSLAK